VVHRLTGKLFPQEHEGKLWSVHHSHKCVTSHRRFFKKRKDR
jgi:hypothetical protein